MTSQTEVSVERSIGWLLALALAAGCSAPQLSQQTSDLDTPPGYAGTGYAEGDIANNFSAHDQNGNLVSLYSYYGGYVVVDFCATWCVPCNLQEAQFSQAVSDVAARYRYPAFAQLPSLVQGQQGFPSTPRDAANWARRFHVPVVLQTDGNLSSPVTTQFYGYTDPNEPAFPTMAVLSPSMRILQVHVGLQDAATLEGIVENDFETHPDDATLALEKRLEVAALPAPLARRLDALLSLAYGALGAGRSAEAMGQLLAFQSQVANQTSSGQVPALVGQGLIDHAGWILHSLATPACTQNGCGCAVPQSTCRGACMDLSNDSANCGACGIVCGGGSSCQAGACLCPNGSGLCGGACPDYSSDSNNCGGCGKVCAAGTTCQAGNCLCPDGSKQCNGSCTPPDYQNDPNNCGGCGLVCPSGQCLSGVCPKF